MLVKVITGVSDAELNKFDVIEGNEYERVTVEVVRMVSVWDKIFVSVHKSNANFGVLICSEIWKDVMIQDNSEKMKVETYVWVNKDDPSMYGEWDYEVSFFFFFPKNIFWQILN